jgi:hypothetical protein
MKTDQEIAHDVADKLIGVKTIHMSDIDEVLGMTQSFHKVRSYGNGETRDFRAYLKSDPKIKPGETFIFEEYTYKAIKVGMHSGYGKVYWILEGEE